MENTFKICLKYKANHKLIGTYNYRYYRKKDKNYYDSVTFYEDGFIIIGTRTSKDFLLKCFESTNNSLYKEFCKCLVICYMVNGKAFNRFKLNFKINNEMINNDILKNINLQYFNKNFVNLLDISNIELLLSSCKDTFITSLSQLIVGINSDKRLLDSMWKSYNAFYSSFDESKNDEKCMRHLKKLLKNPNIRFNLSEEYLLNLDIKSFYSIIRNVVLSKKNNKNDNNKWNKLYETLVHYSERRVNNLFVKYLNEEVTYLTPSLEYNGQISTVSKICNILNSNVEEDNVNFLLFIINEVVYWKRCDYFHANKIIPTFFTKINNETIVNEQLNNLLFLFIIDLFNNLKTLIEEK